MPKERKDRSVSFDRLRSSPFLCRSSRAQISLTKNPLENEKDVEEWQVVRCPVCMEHPHNAVLLMCSSHKKGCRPFMCDTSYRHSNCFDQFRKSFGEASETMSQQEAPVLIARPSSEATASSTRADINREGFTGMHENCEKQVKGKLVCPLCRGDVNGWMVVEAARIFMNGKSRSCACETCDFSGTYADLRKHARMVHPQVRPSESDPERQRDWRRFERETDLEDLMSTLRASVGDDSEDDMDDILSPDGIGWMTLFFLIGVFQPWNSSRSSSWSGSSRARTRAPVRRRAITRHWGESFNGESRDRDTESFTGQSGLRRSEYMRRPESSDGGLGLRRSEHMQRPESFYGGSGLQRRERRPESSNGGSGLQRRDHRPESFNGGSGPQRWERRPEFFNGGSGRRRSEDVPRRRP